MSEDVERSFRCYSHLGDLPEHDRDALRGFFEELEAGGFFTRSYDPKSVDLFVAARILHKHLCTLDKAYYSKAAGAKITEFANAYAKQVGLRELE